MKDEVKLKGIKLKPREHANTGDEESMDLKEHDKSMSFKVKEAAVAAMPVSS